MILSVVNVLLLKDEWFIFYSSIQSIWTLWVGALSRLLPCIFWIFLCFFVCVFFYLPPKVVVLWMNVFQNELCASKSKACVKRDMPHHSEYAYYQRSDSGTCMADGLRLLVLFQNSHCNRRYQVSLPDQKIRSLGGTCRTVRFLICALITGPMRAKDLQCVAVTFFERIYFLLICFERSFFQYMIFAIIILVLHQTFWILWQDRHWGSGFWYLIHWKKRYLL